jgi:hypothetical protein
MATPPPMASASEPPSRSAIWASGCAACAAGATSDAMAAAAPAAAARVAGRGADPIEQAQPKGRRAPDAAAPRGCTPRCIAVCIVVAVVGGERRWCASAAPAIAR